MQVIHKLKMDLLRQNNTQIIDAVQLDSNTRKLELSLYEGAMPWAVPDGVLVAIAYMCDDGTRGVYDTLPDDSTAYEIDGNKITITIIPDALAVVGETKMTIIVSSSESKEDSIATFPVTFRVAENYSVEAKDPEGYVNLMGWLESDHILPVATPNRLGGVKPVAATNEMTQPVGVTQDGTMDDPIPYSGNLALENGKYYYQGGAIYRCTRDSVNPVYHPLADLIGHYVEVATV